MLLSKLQITKLKSTSTRQLTDFIHQGRQIPLTIHKTYTHLQQAQYNKRSTENRTLNSICPAIKASHYITGI